MLIAGPCALKNYDEGLRDAYACKRLGVDYFRAGCFKPRTYPDSFQGLQQEGLEILKRIKYQVGIKVITEITSIEYLDLYDDVDMLQIGSRNCQNFELLKTLAMKTDKPILLKRGFGMSIKEFEGAAAYLKAYGALDVILCERGIKTFERDTRNTLDFAAIPLLQAKGFTVIVDPSHGTGRRDLIFPMSKAAIACGADGLIIETTENPDGAISDSSQTIDFKSLKEIKDFYDWYKRSYI